MKPQPPRFVSNPPLLGSLSQLHATGTALGDPMEVGAVVRTRLLRAAVQPLVLGAGKTQAGHTEAAAGAVGVQLCVEALQQRREAQLRHLQAFNHHVSSALPSPREQAAEQRLRVPRAEGALALVGFKHPSENPNAFKAPIVIP